MDRGGFRGDRKDGEVKDLGKRAVVPLGRRVGQMVSATEVVLSAMNESFLGTWLKVAMAEQMPHCTLMY